jgi:hypothetical protein
MHRKTASMLKGKTEMTEPNESRRRKLLVKRWLQLRFMLVLLAGVVAGGVAYALVLQKLLMMRIQSDLSAALAALRGDDLWILLYPIVTLVTLAFALAAGLLLLLLLRLAASAISRSATGLERYYDAVAAGGDTAGPDEPIAVREFDELARRTAVLVGGYRRKWAAVSGKADDAVTAAAALRGAADPVGRLIALRECERRMGTLFESCKGRRPGRE